MKIGLPLWVVSLLVAAHLSLCGVASSGFPEREGSRPEFDSDNLIYHGLIRENELEVEVSPVIRTKPGVKICSYKITNTHHGKTPFEVTLQDKETGEAKVVATEMPNCEKRQHNKFAFAAIGCDGQISKSATIRISVVDVNEYEPYFLGTSYVIAVDEGQMFDNIVQVEAADDDCSPNYGDICKYEILTPDQPFTIDAEGNIKNTEPLDWNKNRNHILSIVAYDCGMKRSKPVMVNIRVNKVCQMGWTGMEDLVDYAPGSGRQSLFSDATLELCDSNCEVDKVTSTVSLTTNHIGKGCDRDTYSAKSQRKLCGASDLSIDLLPSPGVGEEWTSNLPKDDGQESDQIYSFDGETNAVVIPEETISHNLTNKFTIAVWMKHGTGAAGKKEQIMCNADDHKSNRHHWSLFVRNCRLILLLRREASASELNTFRPAEWRWKLPEVCDDQWHHYVLNAELPEIKLYVDGHEFKASDKNPDIIDDWPLHGEKGVKTTLTVGACWQGSDNKMEQYFTGFLGGLSILKGKIESPDVISCLHSCKESLDFAALEDMEPGAEVSFNSELSQITLSGHDVEHFSALLRNISYINHREFPTPGHRRVKVTTDVKCKDKQIRNVPDVDLLLVVRQMLTPTITVTGTDHLARGYAEIKAGVKILNDMSITVSHLQEDDVTSFAKHKLDSCLVLVESPLLNPEQEYFTVPSNLIHQLGLESKQTQQGLVISGADRVINYEEVLRHIHYYNMKPEFYLSRTFTVKCTELNGRFTSNEHKIELSVIHTHPEEEPPAAHVQHNKIHAAQPSFKESHAGPGLRFEQEGSTFHQATGTASAGNAVTVIVVVCLGFLVFMIVLGVVRIRASQKRSQQQCEQEQEMAWDDSALTITVNPMQQNGGEIDDHIQDYSDSDDDDEGSYMHDDMDSSEEEEEEEEVKPRGRELEWDDSTL